MSRSQRPAPTWVTAGDIRPAVAARKVKGARRSPNTQTVRPSFKNLLARSRRGAGRTSSMWARALCSASGRRPRRHHYVRCWKAGTCVRAVCLGVGTPWRQPCMRISSLMGIMLWFSWLMTQGNPKTIGKTIKDSEGEGKHIVRIFRSSGDAQKENQMNPAPAARVIHDQPSGRTNTFPTPAAHLPRSWKQPRAPRSARGSRLGKGKNGRQSEIAGHASRAALGGWSAARICDAPVTRSRRHHSTDRQPLAQARTSTLPPAWICLPYPLARLGVITQVGAHRANASRPNPGRGCSVVRIPTPTSGGP
jgi:hypothetical protein